MKEVCYEPVKAYFYENDYSGRIHIDISIEPSFLKQLIEDNDGLQALQKSVDAVVHDELKCCYEKIIQDQLGYAV